jgi:CBS domain-containing protein
MKGPTVRETMDREAHAVSPDVPILEAVGTLIDRGVTGVPVVDGSGRALGVLSEEHCLKLLAEGDAKFDVPRGTVADYYERDVPQVGPETDVYYVAGLFLRDLRHRRFPVVENGKLVGVITRKDILKVLRKRLG